LDFRILGPLEVLDDAGRSLPLGGAKQRALLAILLIHANEVVSTDRLIDHIWGEDSPATATTALQGYVSQLRKVLGRAISGDRGDRSGEIVTRAPGYMLEIGADDLDVGRFERLTAKGRDALMADQPSDASVLLRSALALWRGSPLADFEYEPFAATHIEELHEMRLLALEDRFEADLAGGRHAEVIPELEAAVADDPFRERMREHLMLALYRSGRQADALAIFQQMTDMLGDQLGLDPSPALRRLYEAILRQDPSLELVKLEGRANDAPVGLPAQPTGFLGRERELAEALELIHRPGTRLLTLTGPGGSGKTRLTVELAGRLASEYPDGVWFVPLASLTDPALVVPTIAQRVGVRETADATTAQALIRRLGPRHVLLVLDNLERLLPAAAPPVGELLRETENVVLLTSSQQPMHIGGEREYLVPPMSIDDAVDLFAERARSVRQDFVVNGQRAVVEAVCARLDRLPLAIELAAARVRILSVEQLLDRLQQRLPLLTTGAADAPERQRTLRAAIEWSHDLLDEAERALFVRLAAFAGGCTVDAAERICNADLDTLQSLVDKNLLRVDADAEADGDPRFLMLATIHEFALERLKASSEHEELVRRHAGFFLALAEEGYENRFDAEAEWSERLELDHDNLRAALNVWAETDPERALELTGALGWFWLSHGHLAEGRREVTDALERSPGQGPARARALTTAGTLVGRSGDADAGLALLSEGVDLWRDLDDRDELGSALDALGWLLVYDAGDDAASLDAFERSLALRRELADGPGETRALAGVCQALVALGNVERAESLSHELLDRADGDLRTEHFAYHFLADCALIRGDGEEAGNRYQESMRAAVVLGDVVETSYEVQGVAMAAAATGDLRRALRLAAAVEALHESLGLPLGDTFFEALLQRHIGGARESLGAQADAVWAEGRAMAFEDAVDFASTQSP
jgi:predicted ATPase/DNA-binding SARP family transcriptional activator